MRWRDLHFMDRGAGRDPRRRARFRREAILGARPRHRNVVAILEAGELADGSPYLVMEHIAGVELATLLDERGPLPPAAAIDLGIQLLCAVEALAEHAIVHRDIKPQNVMVARAVDGAVEVKLLDFGIVKAPWADARGALTQEGFVLGTPHYMSPEQIRGQPLDARSDLFAVGALLYEALTGVLPIDVDSNDDDVLAAMLVREPPPLRVRAPACPPELEGVIARALAKARDARYPSAMSMAVALERVAVVHDLPRGAAAWESLVPVLDRARAPAAVRAEDEPIRVRVLRVASPDTSQHCLPTPAERPSALRARRRRPRLLPPWWPAVAIALAVLLTGIAYSFVVAVPAANDVVPIDRDPAAGPETTPARR